MRHFKFWTRFILLSCYFISNAALAKVFSFDCPDPEEIIITKSSPVDLDMPYTWIGPNIKNFKIVPAPQKGDQVLGNLIITKVSYDGYTTYNLFCIYPSNATTLNSLLPIKTGYINYKIENDNEGYCTATTGGFTCGTD